MSVFSKMILIFLCLHFPEALGAFGLAGQAVCEETEIN